MTGLAGKPDLPLTLGALVLGALVAGALVAGAVELKAQQGESSRPPPPSCDADSTYHVLDFWVGSWKVYEAGKEVGTNRIEKVLDGCAVVENWKDAEGGEGRSLFYVQPTTGRWTQVWVTDRATAPGGLKEKVLVTRLPSGGTRFQGEIVRPGGRVVLDRTTLTPERDGRVRQVIETSRDGGDTWQTTFDAIYVRAR